MGLLDADIYGPSQPRMMGLDSPPMSPDGNQIIPPEAQKPQCLSVSGGAVSPRWLPRHGNPGEMIGAALMDQQCLPVERGAHVAQNARMNGA